MIQTARLIIRDFLPEDAADLHEILGDAQTMENCEPAYDLEKTERFLTSFCIEKHSALAAVHKESGKMIGYILFCELEEGEYEIGWFFNRHFWRQGYAFEACRAVIDEKFASGKAKRIVAETIDAQKSIRLMEKLGMRLEDIQCDAAQDNHGNRADLLAYALSETDWKRANMSGAFAEERGKE